MPEPLERVRFEGGPLGGTYGHLPPGATDYSFERVEAPNGGAPRSRSSGVRVRYTYLAGPTKPPALLRIFTLKEPSDV